MTGRRLVGLLYVVVAVGLAETAHAEPMFLSKQYTRCTTCHYSPTGGGLLTPYGRSLSQQELSTMGGEHPNGKPSESKEQEFLFGALGDRIAPLNLGFDVRPAHLSVSSGGFTTSEDFLMNEDLMAAIRTNGWTFYGEVGREPLSTDSSSTGPQINSYEYWIGHDSEGGFGFRVGRFLPAYGIRLADHTAFTRLNLGFNVYDQVFGLELSHTTDHRLVQLSIGPGYADSVIHNDGLQSLTATGRIEFDLGTRTALVVSGLFRDSARAAPQNEATGVAFGFSPTRSLTIWSEADVQIQSAITGPNAAAGGTAYTFLNETSLELVRGLWIKLSPQFRTNIGDTSGGAFRTVLEVDFLPRTHWNVDVSVYRDVDRTSNIVTKTILAQLHLYL